MQKYDNYTGLSEKFYSYTLFSTTIFEMLLAGTVPKLHFKFIWSQQTMSLHNMYMVSTSPSMLCYEPSPRMSRDWLLLLTSVKIRTSIISQIHIYCSLMLHYIILVYVAGGLESLTSDRVKIYEIQPSVMK